MFFDTTRAHKVGIGRCYVTSDDKRGDNKTTIVDHRNKNRKKVFSLPFSTALSEAIIRPLQCTVPKHEFQTIFNRTSRRSREKTNGNKNAKCVLCPRRRIIIISLVLSFFLRPPHKLHGQPVERGYTRYCNIPYPGNNGGASESGQQLARRRCPARRACRKERFSNTPRESRKQLDRVV